MIWRSEIDISDLVNISKTIDRYIKLEVLAMQDNDILFRDEIAGEGAARE